MPLGYHISEDEGLITVKGDGEVPLPALAQLGESLLNDAAYDRELPQLLDFRGLRPIQGGDTADLEAFVRGPYRQQVGASVAIVIDEHLEDQHCADIYLLTCAIDEAELFADYDQALRWLMRRAFLTQMPPPSAQQQNAGGNHAYSAPE